MPLDGKIADYQAPVKLSPERQALLDAAQYIREHGWCQGKLITRRGEVCMMGAIAMATKSPITVTGMEQRIERNQICDDAINLAVMATNNRGAFWNDDHGRTADEVIAALESAARS